MGCATSNVLVKYKGVEWVGSHRAHDFGFADGEVDGLFLRAFVSENHDDAAIRIEEGEGIIEGAMHVEAPGTALNEVADVLHKVVLVVEAVSFGCAIDGDE